ncbi:putative citrate lyase beta [Phaeomoniella chlamydospora]|uniref:Putative citrate lyase beta n=1 Tax=Phaeomoniella chlamydospora TaxID=158046 RepID=A0A0G2E3P7_PHACM|nr:putative citrate lyase beta [Phaeomoniella chlamydospora]
MLFYLSNYNISWVEIQKLTFLSCPQIPVPGSSQRFLEKSRRLTADCVAYDLEDSVTPANKPVARQLVRKELDTPLPSIIRERAVRINSVGSGLALSDLTEVLKSPNLTTVVVPKVESASDLTFITDVIHQHRYANPPQSPNSSPSAIQIIALIESAKSVISLPQITTSTPLLSGLIFAAEDFSLDLSITRTPSLTEFLYARSAIVTASRAANLPSTIDLVCTTLDKNKSSSSQEPTTLETESLSGLHLGFNGKQVIHPSQLSTVQRIFSPSPDEIEWAIRIEIAQAKAEKMGKGAWALDGKMIDRPVEGKAKALLSKARAIDEREGGYDLEGLREKWKGVEPE